MISVMNDADTAEDERRGVKRKMSLSRCDVCGSEEARYRCPNCMKHTCSLSCVKQHKMSSGCSGVRDKTAFISLSKFDEMNLLSDYRFLEDTGRLRQSSDRDAVLHASRRHPKEGSWLIRRARAAKVTLKMLPKLFSRHRENTTIFRRAFATSHKRLRNFHKTDGRIHWHLKIHFPQSAAVYSERFSDNREVHQILHDFIHPSESDPVRRQKLKVYVQSSQEDIKIFMKSEKTEPNSLRYLELDPQKTLGANLMHTTVVEYPEIFVVLKQHSQEYVTRMKEHFSAASENVSRKSEEPLSSASSHVPKKAKIISEADELEDGEIRSDDDESNGDDDVTEKTAPESHHDAGDTSRRIAPGDVPAQTETLSSLRMDIRNNENIDLLERQEVKTQTTQTCTVQHQGISCALPSVCGSEALGNMHRSLDGANTNIYASNGDICADGTREKTHHSIDTKSTGFASQHLIPQDIQPETDSNADVCDSMGGENANIYSCEGHVPAVVHSKDASVDRVDVHSSNVRDNNIARDVEGSNQADICEGAENANVYASNSCIPEDTHVESSSLANGENANTCASETCISTDIHVKGEIQVNVENANVYASDDCIARGNQVQGACQMNAEDANVYASDSFTPEDTHVESSSQADVENANTCASETCITADIQIKGLSQVNVENANVYASDDCIARGNQVQGACQMNAEDANVYASDCCSPTDIEGSGQANVNNANVCASDRCNATDMHVEGLNQSNEDTVNVNVYASECHVVADIPSEGTVQVNIGDSGSHGHVSYQTVCGTEHRV